MLRWTKVKAGVYSAASPWGVYTIDGHNYGRNRWTVTYPGGDYGMVDSLGEAKAWAAQHADDPALRSVPQEFEEDLHGYDPASWNDDFF